jgi:hypothetical protein
VRVRGALNDFRNFVFPPRTQQLLDSSHLLKRKFFAAQKKTFKTKGRGKKKKEKKNGGFELGMRERGQKCKDSPNPDGGLCGGVVVHGGIQR